MSTGRPMVRPAEVAEPWLALFARVLGVTVFAYGLVQFALFPANELISFPLHHDDYSNLTNTFKWDWAPVRPVSTLVLQLLSSLGIPAYYLALHALTVVYIAMVIAVVVDLSGFGKPGLLMLTAIALPVMSFENLIDYSKYTGLITNLTSGLLAAGSTALLVRGSRRADRPLWLVAGALACAALSLLAKEDFVLAILALSSWLGLVEPLLGNRNARAQWTNGILWVALIGLVLVQRGISHSPFTSDTGAYATNFGLRSLAETAWHYLSIRPTAQAATWLQLSTLAAAMILLRNGSRRTALLGAGVVLALVLPYAALPNHVSSFYALNWLPWQWSASVCAAAACIETRVPSLRIPFWVLTLLLAVGLVYRSYPDRTATASYYANNAQANRNMVATVLSHRDVLRQESLVGVRGVPLFCPWLVSNAEFLARLGMEQRWLVFVPRESHFYKVMEERGALRQSRVETHDELELDQYRGMPLLTFGSDGTGQLARVEGAPVPGATAGSAYQPAVAGLTVTDWGPRETVEGVPFNQQPTGKAALWALVVGASRHPDTRLIFGSTPMEDTNVTDKAVTGALPLSVVLTAGSYPVTLQDGATGRRVVVGTFVVKAGRRAASP